MNLQPLRGMMDLSPFEGESWLGLLEKAVKVIRDFGYLFVRTPVIERKELFVRSVGEASDIVEKEMYEFKAKDGEDVVLRPEETASIARMFVARSLHHFFPYLKVFTFGPMFRYERPQKGRFREFYQIDVEFIGLRDPCVEVESMVMVLELVKVWNIPSWVIKVNHLGCEKDRDKFRGALREFFKSRESDLCEVCRDRLDRNVLRVLDCKRESCRRVVSSSPSILDFLCEDCKRYFEKVLSGMREFGVDFEVDRFLVRGLDYYTGFVFEVVSPSLGAQNAFIGGGRYDGLIKEFGGPSVPAFGFGVGIDRIFSILPVKESIKPHVFLCPLDEKSKRVLSKIKLSLVRKGLRVEGGYVSYSLKKLLKLSDRVGAKVSVIVGGDELSRGVFLLRNMDTGEQKEVSMDKGPDAILEVVREWLQG